MARGRGASAIVLCTALLVRAAADDDADPASWFLTAEELDECRGGHVRNESKDDFPGLETWTSGNKVDFIRDGQTFMMRLKEDFDAAEAGDNIYGNAWTLSAMVEMDPGEDEPLGHWYDCVSHEQLGPLCDLVGICNLNAKVISGVIASGNDGDHPCCSEPLSSNCTSAEGVFGRASQRGANVMILGWENPFPGSQGGFYLKLSQGRLNQHFLNSSGGGDSLMVLDARQVSGGSSIHQKAYSFLRGQSEVRASFVSGFDVAKCRYDVSDAIREESSRRLRDGRLLSVIEKCSGWLDQGMRIEGPAAADVANTFVQRWNWREPLRATQTMPEDTRKLFDKRRATVLPPATASAASGGSQHVQVLRTYACTFGAPFVPEGEFAVSAAVEKAVSRAKRYVFIEDQYGFHFGPVRDALLEAAKRGVHIVLVVNFFGAGMNFYCKGDGNYAWDEFIRKKEFIFEYNKEKFGDYVHSKTWIVDDCWFMSGSSNLNHRSMTSDPELNAAVMDSSCGRYEDGVHERNWVKRARCLMWAELTSEEGHTAEEICGMRDENTTDVRAMFLELFGTVTNPKSAKLDGLHTYNKSEVWESTIWFSNALCHFTDIEGRCGRQGESSGLVLLMGAGIAALLICCCSLVVVACRRSIRYAAVPSQ